MVGEPKVPPGGDLEVRDSELRGLVERFLDAASAAAMAKLPTQTVARRERMIEFAGKLRERRATLEAELEEAWSWLARNPRHPRHAEFEQIALDMLNDVEAIGDALDHGINKWTGGRHPAEVIFDAEIVTEPPPHRAHDPTLAGLSGEELERELALRREIGARMRAWNKEASERERAERCEKREAREKAHSRLTKAEATAQRVLIGSM